MMFARALNQSFMTVFAKASIMAIFTVTPAVIQLKHFHIRLKCFVLFFPRHDEAKSSMHPHLLQSCQNPKLNISNMHNIS